GRAPLHTAIESQKEGPVRALLERGAKIDLFAAAGLGDERQVALSLDEDPGRSDGPQADGLTPLFYAARAGHASIVDRLLERGARADGYVERWWMEPTPLHAAAMRGHLEVCRLLLDAGADLRRKNEHGYTPMLVAARWRQVPVAALLLDRGADANAQ